MIMKMDETAKVIITTMGVDFSFDDKFEFILIHIYEQQFRIIALFYFHLLVKH